MACLIVDFGMGNLRSIEHKLLKLGLSVRISAEPDDVANAKALILPGVGHFAEGIKNLHERHLVPALEEAVMRRGIPVLGICLGMQLLASHSEEGCVDGLGWIPGQVRRFVFGPEQHLPVPHVGWRRLRIINPNHPLLQGVAESQRFYFVHSFYVSCDDPRDVLATAEYGFPFAAVIGRRNIFGVQFHPEKSQREGMIILQNFMRFALDPSFS